MEIKKKIGDSGLSFKEAETGWHIVRSEREFFAFIERRLREEGLELVETSPKNGKTRLRNAEG